MAQVDVILDVDAWRRRVQEEEARVRAATPEPPVIPESLFEDSLAVSPADPATTGVPTFEEWQAQKRSRDSRFGTATDEQIAEARQVRADKIRAWARDPEWHSNPFPKPVGLEAIIARESGMDPKKTATARWFAEKTKLPFEFVEKNIDWVVKEWKAHSFDTEKMHRESPAITHLLQRAPGNFAVIADDMAHAANYEKNALAPWKASLHRGPAQVEAALRSMFGYAGGGRVEKATSTAQAAVAKGHRPEIAEGLALLSLVGIDIVDDKLVESFSDLNDERISHLKEAHLNRWFGEPSGLEIDERRIAVEVGTAAPQLVQSYGLAAVGAGIGFLVAGPVGAAIGMKAAPMANAFMMEYGPAYDALREYESDGRMFDESTARMGAIGIALVNAAIEIASMSTVLRAGKSVIRGGGKEAARGVVTNLGIAAMRSWLKKSGRKELLKSAAKLWLTSAAAEGTEEFFQDLTQVGARVILKSVEGGEWRPENAAENIGNAFDAFYSTAIGMLALGPLTAGGTAAFGYKRARRADRVAAIYGALSGTKLKMAEEGMGDELVHLAQDYAERTGAPDSFYLSVEDFESVVSKMKDEDGNPLAPEAVASAAFSDPSAYATAKRDGTDIAIPVGDMISKLAGTKFARAILPYVSMHSGGASVISELGVEAARKALSDQGVHLKGLLETAVSEYTPEQQQIYEAERIEIEKQLFEQADIRVHTFTHPEGAARISLTTDTTGA